jgi:PAS domain S-box-containing protein
MSGDRTRRERIEHRLRATEERFRLAQAASGIGWFEWDLTTDEWEWTPHVAVLFGFDPDKARPAFADWHPAIFIDDIPKLRSAVEQVGDDSPYYVEFRVTHSNGSVHWIAGKGEIIRGEAGRALRVAGRP